MQKSCKVVYGKGTQREGEAQVPPSQLIWTMVSGLVRSGMTADTTIDAIHAVYGQQTSATTIITAIKRDKRVGCSIPILKLNL
jgi:hypothetical protein